MEELTNEALVKLIQEGVNKEKNIETLWLRNIKLTRLIIRKLTGYQGNEDSFQDMEQQAFLGFYVAISKYDSSFGVKFFTYAQEHIRQSIYRYYDYGGYSIRIPEYMRSRIKKYLAEKSRLEEIHGKKLAPEVIFHSMGLSPAASRSVLNAIQKQKSRSLDEHLKEDDQEGGTLLDMVSSEENVEAAGIESVYQQELHEILSQALKSVTPTAGEMILAYYFQFRSMSFIAQVHGCTTENVRQHINKGLKTIRTGKRGRELAEFLPEGAAVRAVKKIKHDLAALELTEEEQELLL